MTGSNHLSALGRAVLLDLAAAADEALEWEHVLSREGGSLVAEVTGGLPAVEWDHYPVGDAYDPATGSQYYFHIHPPSGRPAGEVGHFHTFLRSGPGTEEVSHLAGIGIDQAGRVARLFTTNRWVTGEGWLGAAEVGAMVPRFSVDHVRPSWAVNRWVTSVVRLFGPRIQGLLQMRDTAIRLHAGGRPLAAVLSDRSFEIPSEARVTVETELALVVAALDRR